MSDFTTYAEGGAAISSDYPYYMYMYPNRSEEDSMLDEACDACVDFCEQLLDHDDAIDFYSIRKYVGSDYPHGDVTDASDCYRDFKDWCEPKYGDRVGTHLVIEDNFTGGAADGGDSVSKSCFNISRFGACGFPDTSGSGLSEGQATVIHEALHTAIIKDLVVGSDSDDLAPNSEHELGKVWDDGSNDASPFVNNNDKSVSNTGYCSTDLEVHDERNECTYCEKEGVWETTREVF